jgi:hypothetical protein
MEATTSSEAPTTSTAGKSAPTLEATATTL